MRIISSLVVLVIGVTGCAMLNQLNQSVEEIAPSHLTCASNPEFVDGNLETESEIRSEWLRPKSVSSLCTGNPKTL